MQSDTPSDRIEDYPAGASDDGGPPLHEAGHGAKAAREIDPRIAIQFDAIGEEYGRERSRKAMRKGLVGPAALCSAAIGCGVLGGIYIIAGTVLYCMALVSLVRVWKLIPKSTLLDDHEKANWKFRLKLTAAYVVLGGLILVGLSVAFVTSFVPRRPPDIVALPDPGPISSPVGTPKAVARLANDRSLTLDAYIEAGMPAHDRGWAGADMTRMVNVLTTLAERCREIAAL